MMDYAGYGLHIQSSIPLPEMIPASRGIPDVTIRRGKTGRERPVTNRSGGYYELTAESAFLYWETIGGFHVEGGRRIIVEPLPDVEDRRVRLPLLGMVIGAALQQRGLFSLHGSAVSIGGQAAAIVGYSGAGKSTLAAALHARGHALVADDLLALDLRHPDGPRLYPSFPQLKLYPEAASASLGDDPDVLPLLAEGVPKRARRAARGFSLQPLPLRSVYVLRRDETLSLTRLSRREGVMELIRHSYAIRVFRHAMTSADSAEHLGQCTQIANRIPVHRLTRDLRLAAVAELARLVEADVEDGAQLSQKVA